MIKTLLAMARNAFGPSSALPRTKRRKTGAALRNPANPHQAARIEAAASKRILRAAGLRYWTLIATDFNRAHHPQHGSYTPTLNPFHIAK